MFQCFSLFKQKSISNTRTPSLIVTLQVRSFQLSPGQHVENLKRGGIIDVDGEVIARGEGTYGKSQHRHDVMAYGPSIQLTVNRALATVYCPNIIP
jgi:sphingosine kinase